MTTCHLSTINMWHRCYQQFGTNRQWKKERSRRIALPYLLSIHHWPPTTIACASAAAVHGSGASVWGLRSRDPRLSLAARPLENTWQQMRKDFNRSWGQKMVYHAGMGTQRRFRSMLRWQVTGNNRWPSTRDTCVGPDSKLNFLVRQGGSY